MKTRIITAIVALCIFIPIVIAGGGWFEALTLALGLLALSEVLIMQKQILIAPTSLIAYLSLVDLIAPKHWFASLPSILDPLSIFYLLMILLLLSMVFSHNRFAFNNAGVIALAVIYLGLGFHYFIDARVDGIPTIFYALFVVWFTDTGAYFVGRTFGQHKLAPKISPHKTWEGSFGGTIFALIVGNLWLFFFPIHAYSAMTMVGITLILSIVSQLGDLIESAIKRHYGVKDSGKILPGHGGIFDRFDSLLLVLPALHFLGII